MNEGPSPGASRHPLPAGAGRGDSRARPFAPRSGEKVAEGRMRGATFLLLLFAATANAQTIRLTGFLTARGIYAESQKSWLDGGFGRFDVSKNTHQEEAHLGIDWTPAAWLTVHAHGLARRKGGLVEAFADVRKGDFRLRAGEFFLPTSRENTDQLWTSRYTISFSALNTWIGQEFRPIGAELQWQHLTSSAVVTVAGGAFRGNDTMGALLAWRGWSIGNHLAVYNEVLPLPPLEFFPDQRQGTKPFGRDLDGRTGFSGRFRVSLPERATLQFARVDNRGDRELYRGEYSWQTKFNIVSGEIDGQHGTTLASEYGWGRTGMGFAPRAFVDADFYAAYALLSQTFGRNRATVRIDVFGTTDRDHSFAEVNSESGRAWTLAWFYDIRPSLRLGAEFANISAERVSAPDTDGRTVTLEARYRF